MAKRLAGVTRNRSITPDWSSKIVPKPMRHAAGEGQQRQDPGEEDSRGRCRSSTRLELGKCLSSGVKSTR